MKTLEEVKSLPRYDTYTSWDDGEHLITDVRIQRDGEFIKIKDLEQLKRTK